MNDKYMQMIHEGRMIQAGTRHYRKGDDMNKLQEMAWKFLADTCLKAAVRASSDLYILVDKPGIN